MKKDPPYNPLDKRHLGESVAGALLARPVGPMPPGESFAGAGVYAIYYAGDFPAYEPIAKQNRKEQWALPIYVGKAVPAGARKGGLGLGEDPGQVLYGRLCEHADSIEQAQNLDVSDFACRYLVCEDIWIPLAEAMMIQRFQPLWNHHVDGFGNHDPGKGRYNQKRGPWDALHPGRTWSTRLQPSVKNQDEIITGISEFLRRK